MMGSHEKKGGGAQEDLGRYRENLEKSSGKIIQPGKSLKTQVWQIKV